MSLLQLFFWVVCLTCFAVAIRHGERDERAASTIILAGSLGTVALAAVVGRDAERMAGWLLLADIFVLVAFVRLSFSSRKYWPIWVGSLQLVTVAIHFLKLILPNVVPKAYFILQGFWVYPMFFAVMAGVYGSRIAKKRLGKLSGRTT